MNTNETHKVHVYDVLLPEGGFIALNVDKESGKYIAFFPGYPDIVGVSFYSEMEAIGNLVLEYPRDLKEVRK